MKILCHAVESPGLRSHQDGRNSGMLRTESVGIFVIAHHPNLMAWADLPEHEIIDLISRLLIADQGRGKNPVEMRAKAKPSLGPPRGGLSKVQKVPLRLVPGKILRYMPSYFLEPHGMA